MIQRTQCTFRYLLSERGILLILDFVNLDRKIKDAEWLLRRREYCLMQRFENYCLNLEVLSRAEQEDLANEFIVSGIIYKFFIQFELSWKVLKELMRYEGRSIINTESPREIIKAAYAVYDFLEEEPWLSMLRVRNDRPDLYDAEAAKAMLEKILKSYIPAFLRLKEGIEEYYGETIYKL